MEEEVDFLKNRQAGLELMFRDVCVSAGDKQILRNVCGAISPGQLMAVMGPSGSGKTTLLNTLSGRRALQSGEVTLNGSPITRSVRRKICYVMQDDIFFPNLTLMETLMFTAMIRLPDRMKKKEKEERMNELISELDLQHCVNTVMGGMWVPGLSGGERKRASIACELITDPNLILLDEPTSGLDYKTALSLVKTLKNFTESRNKTVVATIHQPSSQIFFCFDMLLLMCDGHSVYYGCPRDVTKYFDKIGYPMPQHYNPADFILEKLKESQEVQERIIQSSYEERSQDSWFKFLKSTEHSDERTSENIYIAQGQKLKGSVLDKLPWRHKKKDVSANEETGDVHTSLVDLDINHKPKVSSQEKWPTGFLTQYWQLTVRTFKQSKSKMYSKFKVFETVFLCVLLSLIWFQLPRSENTLRDRMGLIFYVSMHWGFTPLFDAVISFPAEKMVIFKERAAGWYRLSAYYLAKMTSELPLILIQPFLFMCVVYWVVGLNSVASFFATIGTLFVHSIAGQSIGLCIGIYCMDLRRGISSSTVMIMFIMLLGGFYSRHLPFWLDWVKYLAFLHYTFHCLMYLEFSGESAVRCAISTEATQSNFEICHQVNSTTIPSQEVLEYYGINQPFWHYFLPLFAFLIVFRVLGYLLLRFYQKPK